MKIELRNVKRIAELSDETDCFSAMVVVDGKAVGIVRNSGHGGPNEYGFDTKELDAYCKALPPMKVSPEWGIHNNEMVMDLDLLIGDLMSEMEEKKRVKKACKNKLVFRLKGDEEGSFRTLNQPYSPRTKEWIIGKYGDTVERIMNEEV